MYLTSDNVNVAYYLGIYGTIVVFIVSTYIWTDGMSTFAQIRVSRIIHKKLTGSLLSSTFRWLDTTPTSRIIARCTQDIQSIDGPLVRMTNHFFGMFVMCLSRLVAVAFSVPAFILPGVVLGGLGGLLGQIYIKAQLPIKRERSIVKVSQLTSKSGLHTY
jgi:ABC-type multidrug transport system fused ATPase/permease subunit